MNVVPFPTHPITASIRPPRRASLRCVAGSSVCGNSRGQSRNEMPGRWRRCGHRAKAGRQQRCDSNVIQLRSFESQSGLFLSRSVEITSKVIAQVKSELVSGFNVLLLVAILLTGLGMVLSDDSLRAKFHRDPHIEGAATVSSTGTTLRDEPLSVSRRTGATA
jgi:hypothetical protein